MRLAEKIREESGQDVMRCFQCGECTSSCQSAGIGGFRPSLLMHMLQLGMDDEILSKRAYETCLHCYLCTVRCPQGLSFPDVATALSNEAFRRFGPGRVERAFLRQLRSEGFVNPARVALAALGPGGAIRAAGLRGIRLAGLLSRGGGVREDLLREVREIVPEG